MLDKISLKKSSYLFLNIEKLTFYLVRVNVSMVRGTMYVLTFF